MRFSRVQTSLWGHRLPRTGYLRKGFLDDRHPPGQPVNLSEPCLVLLKGGRVLLDPTKERFGHRHYTVWSRLECAFRF